MMFPVSGHSADKVQQDINTILEAIARFLSKIELEKASQPKPPPVLEIGAELEEDPFIEVEVIPELDALPAANPNLLESSGQDLLEGRDPALVSGSPTPPLMEAGANAEVRLQIGDTYIIALLPEVRSHLEQLPLEHLTTLAKAINQPESEILDAEIISVTVNGIPCLHREQEKSITEDLPSVEFRPAQEAEALIGQELGDSSIFHNQVLQSAAPVEIHRDQYGHIQGGAAVRASVEVTEDAVGAEAEYRVEHQPLTPKAKAVIQELHNYFNITREQQLFGDHDYLIERVDGDRLRFTPYSPLSKSLIIQNEQLESKVEFAQYTQLMSKLNTAYDNIQIAQESSIQDLENN